MYYVMDGRAYFDYDRAVVLSTEEDLESAKAFASEVGGVVVRPETKAVIYDPGWKEMPDGPQ